MTGMTKLSDVSLDEKNNACHEVIRVSGKGLEIIRDEEGTFGIYPPDIVIKIKGPHLHMTNPTKKYENSPHVFYEILIREHWRLKE